jgi:hypothetical protein
MNNFTLSLTKFWKILTITCCLAMLLGVGYWIFTEFTQMDLSSERAVVMGLMGLILSGIFIYGILSTVYDKVIFTADEIQFVGLFRTKVLKKSSIISYSIIDSYIRLNTATSHNHLISVYYSGYSEALGWLAANYPNLERELYKAEEKEIMADASFGLDKREREQNLAAARRRAKVYNIAAYLLAGFILFYPKPYALVMGLGIAFVPIGLLVVATSKGMIKIDDTLGKVYPTLIAGLITIALCVFLRGLLDFDLVDYTAAILSVLIGTILIGGVFIVLSRDRKHSGGGWFAIAALLFFSLPFSYGMVVHLNCYYDGPPVAVTKTEVLKKRSTTGSDPNYYLEVDASVGGYSFEKFEVGWAKYQRVEVGDSVEVLIYPGRLNIAWVDLD